MTRRTPVFASFLLPYDCDLETEAEPKHNMVLIFENDFRSKLQQVWNWQPSAVVTARSVPEGQTGQDLVRGSIFSLNHCVGSLIGAIWCGLPFQTRTIETKRKIVAAILKSVPPTELSVTASTTPKSV